MWLRNLIDSLNPRNSRSPGRAHCRAKAPRRSAATRLVVDALENRSVPASLSISDVGVWEGVSGTQNAEAVVRLSQPSNRTVTVNYYTRTEDFAFLPATAGSDYTAVSGRLTFAPGETQKSILIPIHGDRVYEGYESFTINLTRPKQATIADGRGVVTIEDSTPRLTISGSSAEEAQGYVYFTVWLSSAYDLPVTFDFYTSDGSAVAGEDYVATSGTVTFAPGETMTTIAVPIIADTVLEFDEVFHLGVANTTNAVFDWDNSSTEGWITDWWMG